MGVWNGETHVQVAKAHWGNIYSYSILNYPRYPIPSCLVELPLHSLCWGSTKLQFWPFRKAKQCWLICCSSSSHMIFALRHWKYRCIRSFFPLKPYHNLLCIFITHLFVFLPSFLAQCVWCTVIICFLILLKLVVRQARLVWKSLPGLLGRVVLRIKMIHGVYMK